MKILDRINELANKEKEMVLSTSEKQEQHELRQEYLKMIRGQVVKKVQKIVRDVTPDKIYELREEMGTLDLKPE